MPLREFDVPFEDTTLHCWEGGSGYPLLLLHGSGAGASIPGNFRRVLAPLSRHYRVLAADLVGFGLSGRKREPPFFDMAMWLRQASYLVERLGGPAGVVGHSLSGAIALKLAGQRRGVTAVLTTGTMGTAVPSPAGNRLWRYPETREQLRQSTQVTVFDPALIDDAEVDYRWRILTQPGYREYYESMFAGDKQAYIEQSALTGDELATIDVPVMMLHGRHDRSFPPENTCMRLARSIPADVWLIERCAHSVALEHPDKFLAAVGVLFG
jgi:2-hydroxymuconate-semialdehyde hydrolase